MRAVAQETIKNSRALALLALTLIFLSINSAVCDDSAAVRGQLVEWRVIIPDKDVELFESGCLVVRRQGDDAVALGKVRIDMQISDQLGEELHRRFIEKKHIRGVLYKNDIKRDLPWATEALEKYCVEKNICLWKTIPLGNDDGIIGSVYYCNVTTVVRN